MVRSELGYTSLKSRSFVRFRQGRVVFSSSGDLNRAGAQQPDTTPALISGPRHALGRMVRDAAAGLFNTLFPGVCRLCGEPLNDISRLPVCKSCIGSIEPLAGAFCSICGENLFAFAASDAPAMCGMCRRAVPPFARAVAFGTYEGNLRGLLHLLKYEQVRPVADLLGGYLAEAIKKLQPLLGEAPALVIPVPLHAPKQRQRRFNQAELIARAALKNLAARGLVFELNTRILKRQRETSSQTGLTRHQRRANLRGAFAVTNRDAMAERDILVVDDVFTTGTTVSECARLLVRNGAGRVFVATVARVLKGEITRVEQRAVRPMAAGAH